MTFLIKTFSLIAILVSSIRIASAQQGKVLLYETLQEVKSDTALAEATFQQKKKNGALKESAVKAVEVGVFEKAVQGAIRSLENSIKGTCVREMETSISVTAEGNWSVVGVSITGAMKLIILNPEMLKTCSK